MTTRDIFDEVIYMKAEQPARRTYNDDGEIGWDLSSTYSTSAWVIMDTDSIIIGNANDD